MTEERKGGIWRYVIWGFAMLIGYSVAEWSGAILAWVCFAMGGITEFLWPTPQTKQRETVE